jgi:hypothetical protein
VVWRPDAGLDEALRPVTGRTGTAYESSTPERAHEVLDASFDVETSIRIWHNRDESPEAMYEFLASSNPPIVAYLQGVNDDQRERFRRALVDYWRSFSSDCGVCVPSEYLIVTGKKR